MSWPRGLVLGGIGGIGTGTGLGALVLVTAVVCIGGGEEDVSGDGEDGRGKDMRRRAKMA
jgi:hypothetical protein